MKKYIALLFLLSSIISKAQSTSDIISSNTDIKTCLNETQCSSFNNYGYLFFDESKNKFYLKIDFTHLDITNPADEWLKDLRDTSFYFKANFDKDDFPAVSNHNSKSYRLNGQLFVNHIWHNQTIDMTIFTADNSIMNPPVGGTNYDLYKVNFSLSFSPKDFKIHDRPHHLKNPVTITVSLGRINLLKPGMEWLVGEAYDHE